MNTSTLFWRDPALPHVESRRACRSRACYKPHSHPTFSIGAVDRGSSLFTGAAQGPTRIDAGTLVFVPAACLHACNPLPDTAWSYQMLHLDATWLAGIRRESGCDDKAAAEQVRLDNHPPAYARFCRLNTLLFSGASVHEKEAGLIEFIGDSGRAGRETIVTPPKSAATADRLKAVMDVLQQESRGTPSLAELAAIAAMSRYQLIRAFRSATGMTPHAYQLNLRINQARAWLLAGDSAADIAYRLGFADQSHFQRVFKAHAGVTPGLYRR